MLFRKKRQWDVECDVLVVGSGAAGLTAALAAHEAGAQVALIEKSDKIGGASAVSGGVLWVPNNHHMGELGISDSREEAVCYATRLADGRGDNELIETFVDKSPEMLRFVEGETGLNFTSLARYPDYHPEFEGGKVGGRSLDPGLFDSNDLGEWKSKLRRSPIFGMTALTVTEATEWGVFAKPLNLPFKLLGERLSKGFVCYGGALVGQLLKALLQRAIAPLMSFRARELIIEDGRVIGVRGEQGGAERSIRARKAVILTSGGFEWDRSLNSQFLSGQLTHPNSPPCNEGDGLRMAMVVGAALGNMTEAWWCPSLMIPGEEYDGKQLNRADFATRSLPHSIIVNRNGNRFVNEAQNYNDVMKPFFAFDSASYERPNLPAWLIVDANHILKYGLLTVMPGKAVPSFVARGETVGELASVIGVNAVRLEATVRNFNRFAVEGVDPEFHRGESLYDRFYGDPDQKPNANLGAIEKAPFYAVEVHAGSIGTKGGVRVNKNGEAIRADGAVIRGLYAAGNVMAGPFGAGYPGAGSTIGIAMTFGFLAGRKAASDA